MSISFSLWLHLLNPLLEILQPLLQLAELAIGRINPVVMDSDGEEEDFGDEVRLAIGPLSIELIGCMLVCVDFRLVFYGNSGRSAEVGGVDALDFGESCVHERLA